MENSVKDKKNTVKDKKNTCRICFQEDTKMVPIFIQKNGVSPYENLVHHTKLNISFDDGGSQSMCRRCSQELEILVKFLNKCFRANELFAIRKQNSIGPTKSDKDASKSDKDASKSDKDASKIYKIASKSDKDASKIDKVASKSDKHASKIDKVASKSDKDASKFDKVASKSDKYASKSDKYASKIDKIALKSDKDASKIDKVASRSDKDASKLDPCNFLMQLYASTSDKDASTSDKDASKIDKDALKSDQDGSESDTDSNKLIINEDSISSESEHDPKPIQFNSTKKKMYTCQCCHKAFTRHGNLKIHLNRHSGEREHHCIKCGAGVLTRALARQHCAPRVRRPCPTPGCPMTFLSPQSLKLHIRKHNDEKPFECADCHKKFRCKNTLRDHTKIHSGIKSYIICPTCGKQFATNELSTHMLTHAPNAHTCAACPRDFPSAQALALHAATHAPRARKHACEMCTATYNHRQSLNKHIKKVHIEIMTNPDSTDQPMTF